METLKKISRTADELLRNFGIKKYYYPPMSVRAKKVFLEGLRGKHRRYFKKLIKMLENDEVPSIEGRFVECFNNPRKDKEWFKGVIVSIGNMKLKHKANVSYNYFFQPSKWVESTDVGLKTQIKKLMDECKVNGNDLLFVEFFKKKSVFTLKVKMAHVGVLVCCL